VADAKQPPRPFDATMIEHLVGLMAQHDLSELDLAEGDNRIRLRRGSPVPMMAAPVVAAAPVAATVTVPTQQTNAPAALPSPAPTKSLLEIKSPMVGTFYAKPQPDKDDYVKIGSVVKPDTIVCKLEAMKIFNDLPAELAGKIVEVCVKNGQPVDFGTVLFRLEPG
jgi:acetyl-CoA carboxylase biotin carboxyl carrier protein